MAHHQLVLVECACARHSSAICQRVAQVQLLDKLLTEDFVWKVGTVQVLRAGSGVYARSSLYQRPAYRLLQGLLGPASTALPQGRLVFITCLRSRGSFQLNSSRLSTKEH